MTLAEEFYGLEPCAPAINWVHHGKQMQRGFYLLRGEQIIMNTYGNIYDNRLPSIVRAVKYAFGGGIKMDYWLMDRVMKITPDSVAFVKKYDGLLSEGPVYSDFPNVGIPVFSDEYKMLLYIQENPFKDYVALRNEEIYKADDEEEVSNLFDTHFFGTQSSK